jgi:hypothetical protein
VSSRSLVGVTVKNYELGAFGSGLVTFRSGGADAQAGVGDRWRYRMDATGEANSDSLVCVDEVLGRDPRK